MRIRRTFDPELKNQAVSLAMDLNLSVIVIGKNLYRTESTILLEEGDTSARVSRAHGH